MKVNKLVDLWTKDQPAFWIRNEELSFEHGKKLAQTWADFINVELEHGPFDMTGLQSFMKGLVAGGPTKSKHKTPAIIVTLPISGRDRKHIEYNLWMFEQVLDRGVHGILLCNAEEAEAVNAFVEVCRYSFQKIGADKGIKQGKRGNGGQLEAAQIWGIDPKDYFHKADIWPINPNGELVLGVKIETKRGLQNAEQICKVPGLTFAQYAPGDMAMAFGYPSEPTPQPPEITEARKKVNQAIKQSKIIWMDGVTEENAIEKVSQGVRICSTPQLKGAHIIPLVRNDKP